MWGKFMQHARYVAFATAIAVSHMAWWPTPGHASGWEMARFRGEQTRTVQGCAERFTDDSYVCAYVRCEATAVLALYLAAPGPDFPDQTEIDIDGDRFVVAMHPAPASKLPYVKRAAGMPAGLLNALKTGKRMRFTNAGFAKGYEVIRLTNAGRAIGRIENACRRERSR
ncbi:hypothetical protein [Bosea beijingensis]|uniref:hypothetical protein n=1 Tax=Bosea beijingensis TaxID=3068632 RepID=UPI0027408189|nr:hypothetical protein [Bosea sp. REN20]